jgi:septal ring factor EnvC (AmiA/AmiB activator)
MSIEDRVVNLEQAFLALNTMAKRADERHETVSESIKLLTEMIRHHNERFDHTEAEQSNADARIAALADAQISMGDALKELSAAQSNADARIAALADAQIKTEEALKELSAAQIRTETALKELSATQSNADARIATLADIVERHVKEGH